MVDFPEQSQLQDGVVYLSKTLTSDATPTLARLPDLKDLNNLSLADLDATLEHYGITEPWDSYVANAAQYLARVSSMPPGSDAFREELDRIVSASTKRGALGLSRRVTQQWSILEALDGNLQQEAMWISEDDDATCEPCSKNGGRILKYTEWLIVGLPGAQTCLGGDYCRCDLIMVD